MNIDDCAGAACFNGATCIDRVGAFYCKCTPGKTGKILSLSSSFLLSVFIQLFVLLLSFAELEDLDPSNDAKNEGNVFLVYVTMYLCM